MACMMCAMRSQSGLLFWEEGCLLWFSVRYMLLRLSVKMNVFLVSVLVCSIVRRRTYSYGIKIFGYLEKKFGSMYL